MVGTSAQSIHFSLVVRDCKILKDRHGRTGSFRRVLKHASNATMANEIFLFCDINAIDNNISAIYRHAAGWGFSLVIGGVYITVGWHMGAALYLVILTIVLIAVSVLRLMWLKKKGTEIFRWL